jgi:hypothetical protein
MRVEEVSLSKKISKAKPLNLLRNPSFEGKNSVKRRRSYSGCHIYYQEKYGPLYMSPDSRRSVHGGK